MPSASVAGATRDVDSLRRLATAACLGAALAVVTALVEQHGSGMERSVAASVNGVNLNMSEYKRAVQLFTSEKRHPLTWANRSLILERMIEEELLTQYAVERGFTRSSPTVRAEVLRSLTAGITAELEAVELADVGRGEAQDQLEQYLTQLRESAEISWPQSEGGP